MSARRAAEPVVEKQWKGTGGGMLDKLVAREFGREVLSNCSRRFLGGLQLPTKLIVMLGLGPKMEYVEACRRAFNNARPDVWREINPVADTDGRVVVVHTEHFAPQGASLPGWLSEARHDRGRFGLFAREAVREALQRS